MKQLELRINKEAARKYSLDEILYAFSRASTNAELISLSRKFAHAINSKAKRKTGAGVIFSLNVYVKIVNRFFQSYEKKYDPELFKKTFDFSLNALGARNFIRMFDNFVKTFPPEEIFNGKISVEEYIWQRKNGRYNYETEIAETILIYLLNENPALENIKELFDISALEEKERFEEYTRKLEEFAQREPRVDEEHDFLSFLLEPIRKFPHDIQAQIEFIKTRWSEFIGEDLLTDLLLTKDMFAEDVIRGGIAGAAPSVVPKYKNADAPFSAGVSEISADELSGIYEEEKRFTPDTDWMPNVVMIAKNTFVWLYQLSKKYGRRISRLDEIPDEELETLASYNINTLWLIGVWERSEASQKIKRLRGNPDAAASAYSLYDYEIAAELGGNSAYENLNERAKRHGIRLAADMVPNHTGIFSRWIVEHPDYFIQTDKPPFPNYSFTGENLSPDPNLTIRIEDGYWTNSDAAVVFQRIDNETGETRYIYHGNDGTSMPWNDTAQLDILKTEVREAVMKKIMDVARMFSVIRFDAAMTLTKKHFSRLWYPEPGKGGDIPSRTEYAMTKEEFDKLFPKEFWREVVDRINAEMPQTLLLAEAFWLMEGYFVRTLGMHRVYNSAFMNMLMREENSKYRELIKNTLEFEPEILKRYVNFMSNPDEETAIKQFGSGDKYFGVLTLMVTLPGLPMFAHGQIEGYREKYGMEYKRAYYDEEPNYGLIELHKREIFPIIANRKLFAEVNNFRFYDFLENDETNENVFAYTNKLGERRALVFYNNKYDRAKGKINVSTKKLVNNELRTVTLFEALELPDEENIYITVRETVSGDEFVFKPEDFKEGFEIALEGFEHRVFTDFRFVRDESNVYETLYENLKKRGVSSLETEKEKLALKPLHEAIYNLFEDETIDTLVEYFDYEGIEKETQVKKRTKFFINKFNYLLNQALYFAGVSVEFDDELEDFSKTFAALQLLRKDLMLEVFELDKTLHESLLLFFEHNYRVNLTLLILAFVKKALDKIETEGAKKDFAKQIIFEDICSDVIKHLGKSEDEIAEMRTLVEILADYISAEPIFVAVGNTENNSAQFEKIAKLLESDAATNYLRVNEYENTLYYRKENFEELIDWFFTLDVIKAYKKFVEEKTDFDERAETLKNSLAVVGKLKIISENGGYRLKKLTEALKQL